MHDMAPRGVETNDLKGCGVAIDDQAVRDSFLTGVYAPTSHETTAYGLPVSGTLPVELQGRYLRLGPNPQQPDRSNFFWLSADGMMHGIRLSGGRAHWYRSRYMRSPGNAQITGLSNVPVPAGRALGSSNTSPLVFLNKTYATMEGGWLPLHVTDELESVAASDFEGSLTGGFSGHCKIDPRSGQLVALTYDVFGWLTSRRMPRILVIGTDGRVIREQPVEVAALTVMHDFWLTERYAVVYDLPAKIDFASIGKRSVPFTWDTALQSRIGLVDRHGSSSPARWFDIVPCGLFHTLSAYEDGENIVLEGFRFDRLFDLDKVGFGGDAPPYLHRWTLHLDSGRVSEANIDDKPGELGVMDPRRVGRYNRYAYWIGFTVGEENRSGHLQLAWTYDTLCKIDRATDTIVRAPAPVGHTYGEMVFVPRSVDAEEDDGWLMGFRYRMDGGPTDLVVFSARDIAAGPIGTVHLPVRVPMGFHGSWASD